MSDPRPGTKPWPILHRMTEWCRDWIAANSRVSELSCCGEYEIERIARDLGMPLSELRKVAEHGPKSADLLERRMKVLNLDRKEVAALGSLQDLQRVCTMCKNHRKCAQDLGRDPENPVWEDYCPNVATLKMLDAMPWASRREW
jgi:hypothetical protein